MAITRDEAQALGQRMQGLAARQAELTHDFLTALGEFDTREAVAHFQDIKTTAHYIAWACSMSPGTAREHVRVARALRDLPRVAGLMAQGRLSYSKVRELTRITGHLAEDALCELALEMTASQLARTVAAYRTAAGTRIQQLDKRRFTVANNPDGMTRITIVLPTEEAALITAAVEAAVRRTQPEQPDTDPSPESGPGVRLDVPAGTSRYSSPERATTATADNATTGDALPAQPAPEPVPAGTHPRSQTPPDRVQAILDVAAGYLDTLPGEPTDDHTLVIVQVNAAQLLNTPGAAADTDTAVLDADADTARLAELVCHVEGHGPIEAATAQRLACTSPLLGALLTPDGDVLRLGRTRRLASRAQRRALRIRDRNSCQFPGCHQTRHLDAHHLTPWSKGGTTDLDTMILLCRRHHVHVHEGGIQITCRPGGRHRFHFALPDGRPITGTWLDQITPDALTNLLARTRAETPREHQPVDPTRIFPPHAGAGFNLHECVRVLFDIQQPELTTAA